MLREGFAVICHDLRIFLGNFVNSRIKRIFAAIYIELSG